MAKGYLTTHVLDTALGCPVEGIAITLTRISGDTRTDLAKLRTNADGRTDTPILGTNDIAAGTYELLFDTGDYLRGTHSASLPKDQPLFLDQIPLRFGISDPDAHCHVPLLLSPYGYSTYRGS